MTSYINYYLNSKKDFFFFYFCSVVVFCVFLFYWFTELLLLLVLLATQRSFVSTRWFCRVLVVSCWLLFVVDWMWWVDADDSFIAPFNRCNCIVHSSCEIICNHYHYRLNIAIKAIFIIFCFCICFWCVSSSCYTAYTHVCALFQFHCE